MFLNFCYREYGDIRAELHFIKSNILSNILFKVIAKNLQLFFFIVTVNGNWGSWSGFSSCTLRCGGGTQKRTRLCNDPAPSNGGEICRGSSTESQECNTNKCSGTGALNPLVLSYPQMKIVPLCVHPN